MGFFLIDNFQVKKCDVFLFCSKHRVRVNNFERKIGKLMYTHVHKSIQYFPYENVQQYLSNSMSEIETRILARFVLFLAIITAILKYLD